MAKIIECPKCNTKYTMSVVMEKGKIHRCPKCRAFAAVDGTTIIYGGGVIKK